MAGRDDFGSNSRSPGGWGGSGSGSSMGGVGGQKASNYNYYSGAGQRGPAVGNWNTGGVPVRTGNQYGTNPMGYSSQPFPGGYAGNVVRKPVPSLLGEPIPQTWTPPAVTQEDIPGMFTPSIGMAPQGIPGSSGYYDMREALGYDPGYPQALSNPPGSALHGSTWGNRPTANQTSYKSASTGKQFTDRVPAPSWGDSGSYGYGGRR